VYHCSALTFCSIAVSGEAERQQINW
jgi:hypothetical protein